MNTKSSAGVGWSSLPEAARAGEEAARMALQAAGNVKPVAVIVYMTVLYDPIRVLSAVREQISDETVPIVGASTQGIARRGAVTESDRVVGVAVIGSETVRAKSAHVGALGIDSRMAGIRLAQQLGDPAGLGEVPLLLWFDPLTGANVQALIEGLAEGGYNSIIGGAAGQPWGPLAKTYQYFNRDAYSDSVVALKLEGLAGAVWDTTNGVDPLGIAVTVTEAKGNVICKLDGRPALDVWAEQLLGTFTFHVDDWTWVLGVHMPGADPADPEAILSRGIFGVNEESREITLLAPIPEGSVVQLCHRTLEGVFDRGVKMGERIAAKLQGRTPLLALGFECGGRPRPFLGDEKALEEVCCIQRSIPGDIPWLGMYPWGEIAPRGGRSLFSNYQFPLLVLCQ